MTDLASTGDGDPDMLAGEYALGLLDGAERAAARRRSADEPDFAARVDRWQVRLAPLYDAIEPVAPGPALWPRIAAAVDGAAPRGDNVVVLRRRVTLWRGLTAAMTAIAAALALTVGLEREAAPPAIVQPQPQALLVAALAPEGGAVAMTASYDAATGDLLLVPAALAPVAGHDHELWLIAEGGVPQSLGLVSARAAQRSAVPRGLAPGVRPSATLAISAEPSGGSPTGQPTGPVIATGVLQRL